MPLNSIFEATRRLGPSALRQRGFPERSDRKPARLAGSMSVLEHAQRWRPIVAVFVAFVLIWQGAVDILHVSPFLLPAPTAVATSLWTAWTHDPFMQGHIGAATVSTFTPALIGFGLAGSLGVLMATVMIWVNALQRWLLPYVIAFQTLPRLAIAPLFIIWFGHGMTSKLILATLLAFFPVLVNTLAGLKSVDPLGVELLKSLRANRFQIFRYYQLPNSLPYIFAGLELSLVFSILGVIVAEFVGGTDGVGVLILQYNYSVDVAGVFSVLAGLAVLSLTLRAILLTARKRMLFWTADAASVSKE